jgi:hypothetical protein
VLATARDVIHDNEPGVTTPLQVEHMRDQTTQPLGSFDAYACTHATAPPQPQGDEDAVKAHQALFQTCCLAASSAPIMRRLSSMCDV